MITARSRRAIPHFSFAKKNIYKSNKKTSVLLNKLDILSKMNLKKKINKENINIKSLNYFFKRNAILSEAKKPQIYYSYTIKITYTAEKSLNKNLIYLYVRNIAFKIVY